MVENDSFTDHVKKSLGHETNTVNCSLITQERTEKLELVIHLVSKLTQTIVVCGPKGIGKTTLLKILQEREIESLRYCFIMGNADLNLDKIQQLIAISLMVESDKQIPSLQVVFAQLESQHKKLVLLFDDAGFLPPGLINTVIHYAELNPVLRVIFALTHDDFYLKNRSDSAIDNSLFVEIPPLSENECGEFLQYLLKNTRTRLQFNSLNDSRVEAVYRKTHGIPGGVIAEAPVLANFRKKDNSLWILIAAVAGLVAIALGVQWYSSAKNNNKELTPSVVSDEKTSGIDNIKLQPPR
ncbi:MAG: AAA family ATPase [Methylococcaceae bacterium]